MLRCIVTTVVAVSDGYMKEKEWQMLNELT